MNTVNAVIHSTNWERTLSMANISKAIFWRLIKQEIAYFNKKWVGETDSEKRENERNVVAMYYDSLNHSTEYSLEIAFRNHRNNETTFPKIPQILKYLPRESETYQTQAYKRVPMPDRVKDMHDKKVALDDGTKLKCAEMIQKRFSTDFSECKKIVE